MHRRHRQLSLVQENWRMMTFEFSHAWWFWCIHTSSKLMWRAIVMGFNTDAWSIFCNLHTFMCRCEEHSFCYRLLKLQTGDGLVQSKTVVCMRGGSSPFNIAVNTQSDASSRAPEFASRRAQCHSTLCSP